MKYNLVKEKFDHLLVIEKTERRKNRYIVYKCKYDYEKIIEVNTKQLKNGIIKSYGCSVKDNNIKEDLVGQRFSHLVVLSMLKNKKGKPKWLCACQCGKKIIVNTSDLKSGKIKSCGCLQYVKGRNIKDLTQQRFNRLIALYPTEKRTHNCSVYWHCRCDCGNEIDVSADALIQGKCQSCGCLKKELTSEVYKRLHIKDNTSVEWLMNRKARKDNTSGFQGIDIRKNGQYRVTIGFKKRRFYLGYYSHFDIAIKVRKQAEEIIHENYIQAYQIWQKHQEIPLIFEVDKEKMTFKITTNIDIEKQQILDEVIDLYYTIKI